jgi:hypothetical protein
MGENFLLGVVTLLNSIDEYVKGCHAQLVMSAYVSGVSGFSYRMHIDSNHATLGYEYNLSYGRHHIDNFF